MPALPKLLNPKPNIETRIHRALEEQREKREAEHQPGIMLSSVGRCPRLLWSQLHGIAPAEQPSGKALAIFSLGNAIEAEVIELLRLAGYTVTDRDPETGKQFAVSAYDGQVRGRLDGKIELRRSRFEPFGLLEVKSAKVERFEELLPIGYEAWSEEYADTLHAYLGWSGLRWACVVVYCKNDSRIYAEKVPFDADRFTRLRLKVEHILAAEEKPVARPKEATSQFCGYCKWCDVNDWCWGPLAEVRFDP